MNEYLQYIDAASTPLIAILIGIVWRIKTNDLPHLQDQISQLRGLKEGVQLERMKQK